MRLECVAPVNANNRIIGSAPIGGPHNAKTTAVANRSRFVGVLTVGINKIYLLESVVVQGYFICCYIFLCQAYSQRHWLAIPYLCGEVSGGFRPKAASHFFTRNIFTPWTVFKPFGLPIL